MTTHKIHRIHPGVIRHYPPTAVIELINLRDHTVIGIISASEGTSQPTTLKLCGTRNTGLVVSYTPKGTEPS